MKLTKKHIKCLNFKRFYSEIHLQKGYVNKLNKDLYFLDSDDINSLEKLVSAINKYWYCKGTQDIFDTYRLKKQ